MRVRGVEAEQLVWLANWANFDQVALRSPWDCSLRSAEFEAWLDPAAGSSDSSTTCQRAARRSLTSAANDCATVGSS